MQRYKSNIKRVDDGFWGDMIGRAKGQRLADSVEDLYKRGKSFLLYFVHRPSAGSG
jgi:hypothetical protein